MGNAYFVDQFGRTGVVLFGLLSKRKRLAHKLIRGSGFMPRS